MKARRHLLIAGTGRAGTSFLVRYLAGLGFETHIARHGDAAYWDEEANAGLEDTLVGSFRSAAMPYVVKSPWLYEYIDDLLACDEIKLDAVIIPVRPLAEAAASRIVLELRAMHERAPWMAELERSWEHWGGAIGGAVFSLHPLDQARVLAVGFHRLVEQLVRADVPLVFLDFPRLVQDPDYLFGKLAPILPAQPHVDAMRARAVHQSLADSAKVRIGAELAESGPPQAERMTESGAGLSDGGDSDIPSLAALDRIAIRRELVRLRRLAAVRAEEAAGAASERDRLRADLAALKAENERLQLARVVEQRARAAEALAEERLGLIRELELRAARAEAALEQVWSSTSWRLTGPLRAMVRRLRGERSRTS